MLDTWAGLRWSLASTYTREHTHMNSDTLVLLICLSGMLAFVILHPPALPTMPTLRRQAHTTPTPTMPRRTTCPPKRRSTRKPTPDPLARLALHLAYCPDLERFDQFTQ